MKTFEELRKEQYAWQVANFPEDKRTPALLLLGMQEEIGELSRAFLKAKQGIRGSEQYHLFSAIDALGDIGIYYMGYLNLIGDTDITQEVLDSCSCSEVRKKQLVSETLELGMSVIGLAAQVVGTELLYTLPEGNSEMTTAPKPELVEWKLVLCGFDTLSKYLTGNSWQELITETWDTIVSKRDWNKNKENGNVETGETVAADS